MRHRLDAPVLLGVFYESLCPDSQRFILDQLKNAYSKLTDVIFLELVPYGNAKVCNTTVNSLQRIYCCLLVVEERTRSGLCL